MMPFFIFLLPTIIQSALHIEICVLYSSMEGGTMHRSCSAWHLDTAPSPALQSRLSHRAVTASRLASLTIIIITVITIISVMIIT